MDNLLETFIWVELNNPEDFLKVKETLSRIGIASKAEKKLTQSVHILHKQGRYALVHFKELFALDGKPTDFSDDDKGRRNTIANLLQEWELVKIVEPKKIEEPRASISSIKIIAFKDKKDWTLSSKYNIGKKK